MQAERFGDFRADTRRMVDRLGQKRAEDERSARRSMQWVNSSLARCWCGNGKAGSSTSWCSAPALPRRASLPLATGLAMTGTRWNGYRFFGLPSPERLSRPVYPHNLRDS